MPATASVYLALALGAAGSKEAPPGLIDPSPAVAGHVEVGAELGHAVAVGLAVALARAWYDNTAPPPDMVSPDEHLRLTRLGIGPSAEARVSLGRVRLSAGGAVYIHRVTAKAGGTLLGIHGDYVDQSGGTFAAEPRVGLDWRPARALAIGVRAGWLFYSADLEGVTGGSASLGGPFAELRVELDASGLRPDPAPAPP